MPATIKSAYDMLNIENQGLINSFITLLFDEQSSTPNPETLEAIEEANSGNAPYSFDSIQRLSDWLDADC